MDSGRRVTNVFIAVAVLAMIALAINVSQRAPAAGKTDMSVLPGLAENLRSVSKISGYPFENIRVVRITRTNGDEISVARADGRSAFKFRGTPPGEDERIAFSAILYANAAFLDALASADSFVVTAAKPEQQLGELVYTGFDGFVLENTVFRADDATWLKMTASYSEKLAEEARNLTGSRLTRDEVDKLVKGLQGRIYKKPDEPLP